MPDYTLTIGSGYTNIGGPFGDWMDQTDGPLLFMAVTAAPRNWLGLILTLPLSFDPTLGVPLGAPGFEALEINLYPINPGGLLTDAGVLTPYIVPEYNPAIYTDTLLPGTRNEIACGDPLTFTAVLGASPRTVVLDTSVLVPFVGHSNWRGVVCVSLEWTPGNVPPNTGRAWHGPDTATTASIPIFSSTEYGFNTGFQGNYRGRRGRAIHDFKSGLPYITDEAVPDGYLEGVMVHPDSWDPIDPDPTYVPPAGEGMADDEVSSLE